MADSYRICLIVPPGYRHASCFLEVAVLLKASLAALGYDCDMKVNELAKDRVNVVLGYHLMEPGTHLREYRYIPYQLEQLTAAEYRFTDRQRAVLETAERVWEYSTENVAFLAAQGIAARHLPLGHHPALERIPMARERDIDVVFYGSQGERRRTVLEALSRAGLKVQVLFGAYGDKRDGVVGRAKIVLNIHYYSSRIFEAVRVSYLLNNRCFVVSEDSPVNPYPGVDLALAPYDRLVETCRRYAADPARCIETGERTAEQFRRLYPMTDLVRSVLA